MILARAKKQIHKTVKHDDGVSIILAIHQTGKQKYMLGNDVQTNENMRGRMAIKFMGKLAALDSNLYLKYC